MERTGGEGSGRNKIAELPKQLADKIAAGEVVERPLSIVKELVENSIDAGATFITVEIKKGGKSYIRVTDNGCGIPKAEVKMAFRRHATSKITQLRDLDSIVTLGFRGEALASIAAVSRTEIITKSPDEEIGTSVTNEGGVISAISDTGCPNGMTIIVSDLFYNTPARLKFLKKDNTESTLIIDFVTKIALAYPWIRVRLINNGSTLFTTPGRGDRFSAIATVYDPHTAERMIRIDAQNDETMKMEGYISPPEYTKNNRKSQIFFVNGRYVQSRILEKAVSDAYRQRLFEGRYPMVFLFLDISPGLLDVNIHPNKREIRFDDEERVWNFVTHVIKEGLQGQEAVGSISFKKDKKEEKSRYSNEEGEKAAKNKTETQTQMDIRSLLREKRSERGYGQVAGSSIVSAPSAFMDDVDDSESGKNHATERKAGQFSEVSSLNDKTGRTGQGLEAFGRQSSKLSEKSEEEEVVKADGTESSENASGLSGQPQRSAEPESSGQISNISELNSSAGLDAEEVCENQMPYSSEISAEEQKDRRLHENIFAPENAPVEYVPFDISTIKPVGSIFATYILGVSDDTFYMIDQHAAHERIFYEKLTREYYGQQKASQLITIPIRLDVEYSVKNREEEWIGFLEGIGFEIEEFGPKNYAVKAIPMYMSYEEAEAFLRDFLDSLDDPRAFRDRRTAGKILTKACKSAVKANDRLDPLEINQLLRDLAAAANPFSCPHGRPTIVKMTRREIEALFKR